jgi:C4-dicarboxylate transporter
MRRLSLLFVGGCLLLTSGCATNHVVEWKAKSHVEWDKASEQNVEVAGEPAYYALLPLTVPFDVVTSPIQLGVLLAWPAAKSPQSE